MFWGVAVGSVVDVGRPAVVEGVGGGAHVGGRLRTVVVAGQVGGGARAVWPYEAVVWAVKVKKKMIASNGLPYLSVNL